MYYNKNTLTEAVYEIRTGQRIRKRWEPETEVFIENHSRVAIMKTSNNGRFIPVTNAK